MTDNSFDAYLLNSGDPTDLQAYYAGKLYSAMLLEYYADWVSKLGKWTTFLTLTFRENVSSESGYKCWRNLVKILNTDLIGRHYTRKVKHSYFSYVLAEESQKNGNLHYHALIDFPVNYSLIHDVWGKYNGFAQTSVVRDVYSTSRYLCKYIVKESDLRFYKADKPFRLMDIPQPAWWRENKTTE